MLFHIICAEQNVPALCVHLKLHHLCVCLSVFRISQKRADRFPWNISSFIGVIGRRDQIKHKRKILTLMCKNWENDAKWPTLRKSTLATRARLHNCLPASLSSTGQSHASQGLKAPIGVEPADRVNVSARQVKQIECVSVFLTLKTILYFALDV